MSKFNPKNLSAVNTAASAAAGAEQDKPVQETAAVDSSVQEQKAEEIVQAQPQADKEPAAQPKDEVVQEAAQAEQAAAQEPVVEAVQESTAVITGQIAAKQEQEVLVEQGAGVMVASSATAVADPLAEKLASILSGVPAASQNDITRIRMYCQTMAPKKPVTLRVGAAEQSTLYRSIQNIINRQENYFKELFTALLAIFAAEGVDGALSDRYRNRFMEHVNLSKADRKAFEQLTHMLSMLANTSTRAVAMKQINLERALDSGLTAEGQRRVLQYFGA